MPVVGFRCSNTDYTYAVLSGTADAPIVEQTNRVPFPKGYGDPELHGWAFQEMAAIFRDNQCEAVAIKKAENSVRRSNALEIRTQIEGLVSLAAVQAGCVQVSRRVSATIAKGLGLKGKAKYLQTKLDTTPIADFDDYPAKAQDAILAAWSCL